jgi:catechol 2,3-dioxygenase-like lactoylglutathione lyase family enzyme
MDMKLEVVVVPVSDTERAKEFYKAMGWRLDADVVSGDGLRLVQLTPPGSACSVQFGSAVTNAVPGSAQDLYLVVADIEAAREELLACGVAVSDIFHCASGFACRFDRSGTDERVTGLAPDRTTYASFAKFSDPDGNGWLLQEVSTRLPGR